MNKYLRKQVSLINDLNPSSIEKAEEIRKDILTEAIIDAATAYYSNKKEFVDLTFLVYELMDSLDMRFTKYKALPIISEAFNGASKLFFDYEGINAVMIWTVKRLYPGIEFEETEMSHQSNKGNNTYYSFSGNSKMYQESTDNSINYYNTNRDNEKFKEIEALLIEHVKNRNEQEEILNSLVSLQTKKTLEEKQHGCSEFLQKAANYMTILSPFIPYLIEWVQR